MKFQPGDLVYPAINFSNGTNYEAKNFRLLFEDWKENRKPFTVKTSYIAWDNYEYITFKDYPGSYKINKFLLFAKKEEVEGRNRMFRSPPRKFKVGDLVYPKDNYFPPTNIAKDFYEWIVREWNRTGCPFEVVSAYEDQKKKATVL